MEGRNPGWISRLKNFESGVLFKFGRTSKCCVLSDFFAGNASTFC